MSTGPSLGAVTPLLAHPSAKVLPISKRAKRKGGYVTVSRASIYFPTHDDPEGNKHAAQKYLEADAGVNLLLVAIAKSGISIDLLDLPGAAAAMKADAEEYSNRTGIQATYPGDSVVHACVAAIRQAREVFDAQSQEKKNAPTEDDPAAA